MADHDLRTRADARLAEALESRGLADPRETCRAQLRRLKDMEPAAFERACSFYENTVLVRLAEPSFEPLAVWIEYGEYLARLEGPGKTIEVAADGRATPFESPVQPAALILFIPDDDHARPVLVLARPADLSPPQQATLQLLVR